MMCVVRFVVQKLGCLMYDSFSRAFHQPLKAERSGGRQVIRLATSTKIKDDSRRLLIIPNIFMPLVLPGRCAVASKRRGALV